MIPHARNQDHDRNIRQLYNLDLILTHTYGFDDDRVAACRVQDSDYIGSRRRQTSQITSRGHATNVDVGIDAQSLHPDPVTENRAPGERAARIDSHDAQALVSLPVIDRQSIHQ